MVRNTSIRNLALGVAAWTCLGWMTLSTTRAGTDLVVHDLALPGTVFRSGNHPNGVNAFSAATTVCNQGTDAISWRAAMDPAHPGMVTSLFRMAEGRFEQIGISDVRHFYFALPGNACLNCSEQSNGTYLPPGCSDSSGSGSNADQFVMGPRSEWNPFTGDWQCIASHFSDGQPDCVNRHEGSAEHEPLEHRLTVLDADLQDADARFFFQTQFLVGGEESHEDNLAFREVEVVWTGTQWSFTAIGGVQEGAAIQAAEGTADIRSFSGDGALHLSGQVEDLGNGSWHYEYSLYNLAAHTGARRFSVPVGAASISNLEFRRFETDPMGEWSGIVETGQATWEVARESEDPNAPALLFGQIYTFSFDADVPPESGDAAVGAWRTDESLSFAMPIPRESISSVDVQAGTAPVLQVSPNPVRGTRVGLQLNLQKDEEVELEIYTPSGRRVESVYRGSLQKGRHQFYWSPRGGSGGWPAGIYYARLTAGQKTVSSVAITQLGSR